MNIYNILIIGAIVLLVIRAVRRVIQTNKQGGCGCGCSSDAK